MLDNSDPARPPEAVQPIIDECGFDQFGFGPLGRRFRQQLGIYPESLGRKKRGPVLPLGVCGCEGRDRFTVEVNVAGLATSEELRALRRDVDSIAAAVAAMERQRGRG